MQPSKASSEAARRVIQRCDELALCTERPGEITRTFCSTAMRAAHESLKFWMVEAGLICRLDSAGNLIGHRPPTNPTTRTLLTGSHLDSVVNAGRYDGALGVMMGLALAEMANETQATLPFAIDVIGFCEEEGVRFQTPYIGSRAIVGELTGDLLSRRDASGCTMAEALRGFGGDPDRLDECRYDPAQVVAYLEPHIEQGPVLEQEGLPVGIVTGIAGQSRGVVTIRGQAGHAGTVPMATRRDALAAAAELIGEVERTGRSREGLVATVGMIEARPNVRNVIPGEARLTLDVRHLDDAVRRAAYQEIVQASAGICGQRKLGHTIDWVQEEPALRCDPGLASLMEQSVVEAGIGPFRLPSGAGHDAGLLSRHFPAAMLFLRCAGGLSHHPDEAVAEADVAIALEVLWRFVLKLAAKEA